MTQQNKELLLKDLSGRLLYGVICTWENNGFSGQGELTDISQTTYNGYKYWDCYLNSDGEDIPIEMVKPYLRPMSSMTKEERKRFQSFFPGGYGNQWLDIEEREIKIFECERTVTLDLLDSIQMVDWLNSHHFDYHNLIDKGLAIEVTEENNPYKQ